MKIIAFVLAPIVVFAAIVALIFGIVFVVYKSPAQPTGPIPISSGLTSTSPLMSSRTSSASTRRPITSTSGPSTPMPTTQSTPGWIAVSNIIQNSVNFSVDPCQNFYEYACGSWMENNPIPTGSSKIYSFGILRQKISNELASAFTGTINSSWPQAVQTAANLYQNCMKSTDDTIGGANNPLLTLFTEYGGWPAIDPNWDSSKFNPWVLTGALSGVYQINTLINPYIDPDWKHPAGGQLLYLDQGVVALGSTSYYLNQKQFGPVIEAYKHLIANTMRVLAKDLGSITTVANSIAMYVEDIVDFETYLSRIITPPSETRDYLSQYNPANYTILIENFPNIDWCDDING